jgi:hypothetical protein
MKFNIFKIFEGQADWQSMMSRSTSESFETSAATRSRSASVEYGCVDLPLLVFLLIPSNPVVSHEAAGSPMLFQELQPETDCLGFCCPGRLFAFYHGAAVRERGLQMVLW